MSEYSGPRPDPPLSTTSDAHSRVPDNSMGTAALVMAVLQFVCLGPIASILAIVFGRIGMNKARKGLATNGAVATASFWLGITGLVLGTVATVIAMLAIGLGVTVASKAVDPARNSETGLVDGAYAMHPETSLRLVSRCAFGGRVTNLDTLEESDSHVTVVGEGRTECGPGDQAPELVLFSVSGGKASIDGAN